MNMPRREEITLFNAVCIFAVVLVHSAAVAESLNLGEAMHYVVAAANGFFDFLFGAFIFLSGLRLFLNRYDKMTADTFYVNRFLIVIVPYSIFAVVYYAFFCLSGEKTFAIEDFLKFYITGGMFSHAYFIWVLAQLYVAVPILARLLKKANNRICLFVLLLISLAGAALNKCCPIFERLFVPYLFTFALGAVSGLYYKEFKTVLRTKKALLSVGFILSLAAYEAALLLNFSALAYALLIFYSVFAALFLFMLSTAASDRFYIKNFIIKQTDKSAYFIFLVHGLVINLADIVISDKLALEPSLGVWALKIVSVLVVTVLFSIIWRYIRNIFLLKRYV